MIPLSIDRDELNFVKKEIMEEINMVFEENSEKNRLQSRNND